MLSFKKYMNQIEEAAATVPAVGTTSATTKTPAPTMPINPDTRKALETAAKANPVALRLFSTGNQTGAVKKLREDPKFLTAMAQVTAANPAANAAALVNAALGGNP
jgi:hypothetical protein